ncbi:MAG: YpsA SLOG family protein, partial [Nitrospirales bacterium]
RLAKHHHKPYLVLNLDQRSDATVVSSWLNQHDNRTLNIAGPRESTSPGIYESAYAFLHTFVHQYEEKDTSRLFE